MVARNHKFARSHGHSRRHEKQDIDRWVAEDLEVEGGTPPLSPTTERRFGTDLVLDLPPRVTPRTGIDLRAVVHTIPSATAPGSWRSLARRCVRRLGAAAGPLGRQLLRGVQQLRQRLLGWISWR